MRLFRTLAALALLAAMAGGLAAFAVALATVDRYGRDLPDHLRLATYVPRTGSRILASDGALISRKVDQRRTFVPYAGMPPLVVRAFLSAEDRNYFSHSGVDRSRSSGPASRTSAAGRGSAGPPSRSRSRRTSSSGTSAPSGARSGRPCSPPGWTVTWARSACWRSTSTRSTWASGRTGSRRPRRPTSASRWAPSNRRRRPSWPECRRPPPPSTRCATPLAPWSAATTCCGGWRRTA